MFYHNRGNRHYYGPGCSMFGCLMGLFFFGFILRGSIFFFFRYFWLILILGLVVWAFRKMFSTDSSSSSKKEKGKTNWQRDYENRTNTAYHNKERDFEEVDEDEFDDF